jgi:BirA family biotin operon repressor/biotin-[acetyl-CoA-carboxylase] ligase
LSQVVPHIIRLDSVSSTQSELKQRVAEGAQGGTVVVAKQQTEGRGRAERHWHSPVGGLYFSILLKPSLMIRLTDLALLSGTAMAQTVKKYVPREIPVGVKWPNDVLIQNKKVGGVLCEASMAGEVTSVFIGVGLNINIPPSELTDFSHRPFKATSFLEVLPDNHFALEDVLQTFLRIFFNLYDQYLKEGFRSVQVAWEKECLFLGKKIELKETGIRSSKEPGTSVQGTFLGIDEQGALVVSTSDGDRKSYVTGEITCCWY